MVLNVTWAELEPTSGQFNYAAIDSAVNAVSAYNSSHGTDIGIKLRVWGGVVAPDWVKNLDGPPVATSGKATIDPTNYGSRTFPKVWTADYNEAWLELQTDLATHVTAGGSATYDGNPIIRGISQTAGITASDEPFVSLPTSAPISSGATQGVDQFGALVSGGYSDYAEMLTLAGGDRQLRRLGNDAARLHDQPLSPVYQRHAPTAARRTTRTSRSPSCSRRATPPASSRPATMPSTRRSTGSCPSSMPS